MILVSVAWAVPKRDALQSRRYVPVVLSGASRIAQRLELVIAGVLGAFGFPVGAWTIVQDGRPAAAAVLLACGAVFMLAILRTLFSGLYLNCDGVRVRRLFSTRSRRWAEIARFATEPAFPPLDNDWECVWVTAKGGDRIPVAVMRRPRSPGEGRAINAVREEWGSIDLAVDRLNALVQTPPSL